VAGYYENKEAFARRLRRIEGQVRGVQRMVEADTYCIDILTQIGAIRGALDKVATSLLGDHLAHCVAESIANGADGASKVREATQAVERLIRA